LIADESAARAARPTAIIGLGLMGGSLARDLAAEGSAVVAYDNDAEVVTAAIAEGVVGAALDESLRGVAVAELVIIATPVDAALAALTRLAPYLTATAIVTDVGSVKRPIESHADQLGIGARFVGSHPLAGDHRSGWRASRSSLFSGAPVFLCPGPATSSAAVTAVDSLWTGVGARTETIGAAEHDRRMAWLSHLPQIASSALAGALRAAGRQPAELGPGGRDATRLAASSSAMWSAISLANADNISIALAELRHSLEVAQVALDHRDPEALFAFFERARSWLS
jgi:cyclohexadieny/prephenate dehydrogenase